MSRLFPPHADPVALGQLPAAPPSVAEEGLSGYRTMDLVATSADSLPDAIGNALARAAELVPGVDWFELTELRGTVVDGKVGRWMVGVKVGYRAEPAVPPRN